MKTRKKVVGIQWVTGGGFFLILALSWIVEFFDSLRVVDGVRKSFDWEESAFLSLVVLVVAIPVILLLRRLVDRLYYLEGFLSVCAWCKKVNHDGEWISMDEFFARKFQTETSHGICTSCVDDLKMSKIQ